MADFGYLYPTIRRRSCTETIIALIVNKINALLKVESYRKGIVLSTAFNVLSKGLVFLNSLLIAYYFGAQLKMDIYFYAYNSVVILSALIGSLNASVLIPESMRIRAQRDDREAMEFLNFFIALYFLFCVLLAMIFLINPVRAFHAVSGFSMADLNKESAILWLSLPLLLLMPVVNLLTEILASQKYFTVPMLAAIINGLFSIGIVIFFHRVLDVLSLLTGLIIAYLVNLILLLLLLKQRLRWRFRFRWIAIERRIWKNIGFAQAGNITTSLGAYAPLYLLSGFQTGIITSLSFAQQIASLPTNLITNQFSYVAGIKFNESYAGHRREELNAVFLSTADFLLFILMPVAALFFIFPTGIVSVLLEHGAFGRSGVSLTADFLRWLGLLPPLLVINTLFARLFMASHQIVQSFWYQIAFNAVLILALCLNVRHFGYIAYPVTLVSMYGLNLLGSYFLEKKYFGFIDYLSVLRRMAAVAAGNGVVAVLVWLVMRRLHLGSALVELLAGVCLYLTLILILGYSAGLSSAFNQFTRATWKRGWQWYGRRRNP